MIKKQIDRWKRIVNRFKGNLIKMIKDVNGRFDDYSILLKIKQILLHWGYELVESDLFWFIVFIPIKISYYWFDRKELLQKAKGRYRNGGGKEKAAEYCLKNWGEGLKENANNKYRSLSEEENEAKRK